ncbi:MAG: hypothetical protein GY820_26850, partial [Gammaproteobacteria bacterium]|nr:hypothetical protein [Gammaproteobacteria bacterium]
MSRLIHGVKQQMNPSVLNYRGLKMRDVKETHVKLWGQNAKTMDFGLRGFVTGALTQVRDSRGMVHLPYVTDHRREHHQSTKEAMAPAPPLKKMVGSIKDIATLDSSYRSTAVIPETGMELPVMVEGGRNPLFIEHMIHRMSFLCQKDEMAAGPEFHQRYSKVWDNDAAYCTADDLVVRIMNQHERQVPHRGDHDALKTSNVFSMLMASSLGQSVNSPIIDRDNILDGIDELKMSLRNSGSDRLAMYVQEY